MMHEASTMAAAAKLSIEHMHCMHINNTKNYSSNSSNSSAHSDSGTETGQPDRRDSGTDAPRAVHFYAGPLSVCEN